MESPRNEFILFRVDSFFCIKWECCNVDKYFNAYCSCRVIMSTIRVFYWWLIYKFCNIYLSIFTLRRTIMRDSLFAIYSRQVLDSTTDLIHTCVANRIQPYTRVPLLAAWNRTRWQYIYLYWMLLVIKICNSLGLCPFGWKTGDIISCVASSIRGHPLVWV